MKNNRFYITAISLGLALGLLSALLGCKSPTSEGSAPTYVIVFNSDGGSSLRSVLGVEGEQINKPGDPWWTGTSDEYVFRGWYSEPGGGGHQYTWPHTLTGNVTMYAYWKNKAGPFVITFDTLGGVELPQVEGLKNSYIRAPDNPVLDGYTFLGWYNAAEGGEFVAFPHKIDDDLKVYARWHDNQSGPPPQKYTIEFISLEGSEVPPVETYNDTRVMRPGNPLRDGYAFLGWFTAAEGGTEYEWPHTLTEDVLMYAQWRESRFTIAFDTQGGSEIAPIIADAGIKVYRPSPDPLKEGYIFQGWYTEASGGGSLFEWSQPREVEASVTLYAKWQEVPGTRKQYTVSFDTHGGNPKMAPIKFYEGSEMPYAPIIPEHPDSYKFNEWFTAQEGGEQIIFPYVVTADITVHAQWEVWYTIVFENTPEGKIEPWHYPKDAYIDQGPAPQTNTGYKFVGWYSRASGGTEYVFPYILKGDVTMWARWEPLNRYTVNFDSQGGSQVEPVTALHGEHIAADKRPAAPVKAGYLFDGWYGTRDASDGGIDFNNFKVEKSWVLYAKWTPITYTVVYHTNRLGETESTEGKVTVTVRYDEGIKLDNGKNLTKPANYEWDGWNTSRDGTGTHYFWDTMINNLTSTQNATINLYAQWVDENHYTTKWTITFNYHTVGVENLQMSVVQGSSANEPYQPSRKGYTFEGWYSVENGPSIGAAKYTWPYMPTGDTDMHAGWKLISYNIRYYIPGTNYEEYVALPIDGNNQNPPNFDIEDDEIVLNDLNRVGYNFIGWYAHPDLATGGVVDTIPAHSASGHLAFYAKSSPVQCILSFNANGGTGGTTGHSVKFDDPMPSGLNAPSKAGYDFAGYYDVQGKAYYDREMNSVQKWDKSEDTTLYAHWTTKLYKITYYKMDGTILDPASYTVNDNVTLPVPSHSSGAYTFAGWYATNSDTDNKRITAISAGSSGDKVFYAKWTPIAYKITYNMNGGANAAGNPGSYTYESAVVLNNPLVRTAYDFAGWYKDPVYSVPVETIAISKGSTGDKVFYAKWVENSYTVTYDANGGSGSTASSLFNSKAAKITLSVSSFTRTGYVFGGWNTSKDGTGTLYPSGRPIDGFGRDPGTTMAPLYAYWLPLARTIELDKPWRTEGAVEGNYRWSYFPDRKEYIIYANNWPAGEEEIYVTGSAADKRIRVVPETMILSDWNQSVRGINTNTMQNYVIKSNAYACNTWPVKEGYPGNRKIPEYMFKLHSNNAHWQTIVFVNAEIKLDDETTRSPVDVGPYHDGDGTGFMHGGRNDGHSDYEVHAYLRFKGAYNVLENTKGKAIAVWDSKAEANVYNSEVPTPPDSDSVDSWRTSHNLPYWEAYRITCLRLVDKWGLPAESIGRLYLMGWGPSSVTLQFDPGGKVELSRNTPAQFYGNATHNSDIVLPGSGAEWAYRRVSSDKAP